MAKESRGDGRRLPRVERELRDVIGSYLLGGFRGELPGLVSVSRVILSGDLRQAKVLITLMAPDDAGDDAAKKAAVTELQSHAHEVQHEVNRKLRLKYVPKITFLYDEGFEHALKVENILRDISKSAKPDGKDEA